MTTSGVREEEDQGGGKNDPLTAVEAPQFRAIAARFNYLAADCPNFLYATKEVCREMANPTLRSQERLKRLARYLMGVIEVKFYYRWQSEVEQLRIFVDSDWAG